MIVASLLLILVAVVLLVVGLAAGSSTLLISSIVASLLAAVALVIGARQAAARRAVTAPGPAPLAVDLDDDPGPATGLDEPSSRFAPVDATAARVADDGADTVVGLGVPAPVDDRPTEPTGALAADPPVGTAADTEVLARFPGDGAGPDPTPDDPYGAAYAADEVGDDPYADFHRAQAPGASGRDSEWLRGVSGDDATVERPDADWADGEHADLGPADLGPADLGPADLGPADLGPADPEPIGADRTATGAADLGRAHPSPSDPGPAAVDDEEPDSAETIGAARAAASRDVASGADPADDEDPADEPPPQRTQPADAVRVSRMVAEVLVVDGRPRYHLGDCTSLVGRITEGLPVAEAVELGFTPCSRCRPVDRLVAEAVPR